MIRTINSFQLNKSSLSTKVQIMPFGICETIHKEEPNHRHDFYEIIFVVKGSEHQLIDNEIHEIQDNQIFLLSPYNVHNIESAKIEEGIIITFGENILYKTEEDYLILQNIIFGFGLNQQMIISQKIALKLKQYIKILDDELKSKNANNEIIYSLLKVILISIQNEFTTENTIGDLNNSELEVFYKFIELLNHFYKQEHLVTYYASELNVTPATLNKIVQKVTGKNTLATIHERLIQESKRLLIHSNYRNKVIAFELGFKDEAYFSRFFKKITGHSPKQFKINVQEKE